MKKRRNNISTKNPGCLAPKDRSATIAPLKIR